MKLFERIEGNRFKLNEGVTTSLSNTDEAERIGKKLWKRVDMIDVLRDAGGYFEFTLKTPEGPQLLRQYKNGPWFYFNNQKKVWRSIDQFNKFRKSMGADRVDEFLSKFGLGTKYEAIEPKTHICPECNNANALYKEVHADTDINEMVLSCPDCGHSSSV